MDSLRVRSMDVIAFFRNGIFGGGDGDNDESCLNGVPMPMPLLRAFNDVVLCHLAATLVCFIVLSSIVGVDCLFNFTHR